MGKFYGAVFSEYPDVRTYDPTTGWYIRRRYKGTPQQMEIIRAQLIAQGVRFEDDDKDGGYETVTAVFMGPTPDMPQPHDQPLISKWDLVGNTLEKDLWSHPSIKERFDELNDPPGPDGYPTDTYAQLKRDIEDLVAGEKAFSDLAWWPDAFPVVKGFVRALMRGVTHYPISQYVLRNTLLVAENYSLKPDLARVYKAMTSAQLRTFYSIPATIKFNLPESGYWVEQTPTVENEAAGEYKILREWWHADDYDPFVYTRVTS